MVSSASSQGQIELPLEALSEIRAALPPISESVVDAIIAEVPSYADAFTGPMGRTIREAVQLALGGFLSLATRPPTDSQTPLAPAVDGAYQLGRGEARSGRTTDALLSAYRIGARVSWQQMSAVAVDAGLDARTLTDFAALVFAYIDELSAASVAGHTDELATSGRLRERLLDRLAAHLISRAPEQQIRAAAERADWPTPDSLTAVLVTDSQVRPVLAELPPHTLTTQGFDEIDGFSLLLVPDVRGARREVIEQSLASQEAVIGPEREWLEVADSVDRARRALLMQRWGSTEDHLSALVLTADADALRDLRVRALAPLAGLRDSAAEKLTDTLRAWVLHQGRREEMAQALFVHPQTVRYRMGQLRDIFGEDLEDPATLTDLTLALALPE